MKIKIGPYVNYIGPYQLAKKILFWVDRNHPIVDTLAEFLHKIPGLSNFCEWVYSKRNRKVVVKIDNYDTWGMNTTLSHIIVPMLKQLKETKHGIPASVFVTEDGSEIPFDQAERKWDEIMDKMIWAFEQHLYEWDDQFYDENHKCDIERLKQHHQQMLEGFQLFGKHYDDLWD